MAKYSKIYKVENKKFRYNFTECLLEWVTDTEYEEDLYPVKIPFAVIDSIGLSPSNWKDNPQYWAEKYYDDIEEEEFEVLRRMAT